MSISRQQLIKNSVWTFSELVLYPALMIVATPLFIRHLGIVQYGLWMLVSTITIGINALNIGVGDTNIRLISGYRASGDEAAIRRVFNYNFSLSLFLCVCAVVLGLLFYFTGFIRLFYKEGDDATANFILLLACCASGVKLVEIGLLSVFKAFERFDISSRLIMISKNSALVINILLVVLGQDLVNVFLSTLFCNITNVLIQLLMLSRFRPGIIDWPGLLFFREKLDQLNYNLWYWAQSAVALLGFMADKLVVAWFTDAKTIGYYSLGSLVGTQIHNFFLSFGGFIFPRVSFKLAANAPIERLYFVTRCLVVLLGWGIISFLLLFSDQIFGLWLGHETWTRSAWYIRLYLVFEAGMLLIIVPFHFINGSNQIRLNTLFEVVLRSSHFLFMLLGYYFYGITGILYGLIFSTFLNIPFQYFFFHNRVVHSARRLSFLWVIVPVLFLAGLAVSENLFFKLSLMAGLLLAVKVIYFDPARTYAQELFDLRRFLPGR